VTSRALIPADAWFKGVMRAREDIVVAGLPVAERVFRKIEPATEFEAAARDGDKLANGAVIAHVRGPACGLLTAERTALNFLQHLSGIATLTRRYADRIDGTGAVLLDTRKTIPGLRVLNKYATRMGGAVNHRMRLDDAVLIKDNHIAVSGSVAEAVKRARAAGHAVIEVECDSLTQVEEALGAGANTVMFDNMDVETLKKAVALVGGKAGTEASGGVRLETIRAIAETGVDTISVGRITQSAPAVDIGFDWEADGV
jgi:nicotinate-nucleotide pyrophosphorylase (carboxylating)